MKAVQVTDFGSAKVLALTELADPEPGPGQVAVDVTHAAVGLIDVLGDEKFDVIVDPVGGQVRTESLKLLAPGGRLLLVGNATGDWQHGVDGNTSGLADTEINLLPLADAATAHERLEDHTAQGRIVLVP